MLAIAALFHLFFFAAHWDFVFCIRVSGKPQSHPGKSSDPVFFSWVSLNVILLAFHWFLSFFIGSCREAIGRPTLPQLRLNNRSRTAIIYLLLHVWCKSREDLRKMIMLGGVSSQKHLQRVLPKCVQLTVWGSAISLRCSRILAVAGLTLTGFLSLYKY